MIKKLCKCVDIICVYFEVVELVGFDDVEVVKIFGCF